MNVSSLSRFELAARVALDAATSSWFVVGADSEQEVAWIGEEIEGLIDATVAVIRVTSRESLVSASRDHATSIAIFFAPVPLEDLHLDHARSLLQRDHAAVLVTPTTEITRMLTVAPHFTSWAGNRAFLIEEDRFLDDETQEARLQAFRDNYAMNDDEFLAHVQRGDLAFEPEHAEWLVLLDRADLLEGRR